MGFMKKSSRSVPARPTGLLVVACALAAAWTFAPLVEGGTAHAGEEVKRKFNNERRSSWPWDLTYMDFPAGTMSEPVSVKISAVERVTKRKDEDPLVEMVPPNDPVVRAGQVEKVTEKGKTVDRVWWCATIKGNEWKDEKGKTRKDKPPRNVEFAFLKGVETPGQLSVKEEGEFYLIDNGVYEFRLRKYGELAEAKPLQEIKHWIGGMRMKGFDKWDGKAFFEGTGKVKSIKTEILNQGPVFWDFKITYEFDGADTGETTTAMPVELGKQTYKWEPNVTPTEEIARRTHHYEVALRFIDRDPWIEAAERYHLPRDKNVKSWGIHQYYVYFGETRDDLPYDRIAIPRDEYMPIDTAFWVRWFLYDTFGGNSHQNYVPAEPRKDQKGRPFALMRPRWNQGGGGAQDFFLTSGGKPPASLNHMQRSIESEIRDFEKKARNNEKEAQKLDKETAAPDLDPAKKKEMLARKGKLRADKRAFEEKAEKAKPLLDQAKKEKDDRKKGQLLYEAGTALGMAVSDPSKDPGDNPAIGVVAAYPSKWVGPYKGTIRAYVRPEARCIRVPLEDGGGGGGNDGDSDSQYYGNRAYALCVGPRRDFRSINNLVRHHTDWTLVANMNKYILEWERDPSVAGCNILMSREDLKRIQADLKADKDTHEVRVIKEFAKEYEALKAEQKALEETAYGWKAMEEKAKSLQNEARKLSKKEPEKAKALAEESKALQAKANDAKKSDAAKDAQKALKSKKFRNLKGHDVELYKMLLGEKVHGGKGPNPGLYLGRRYQDDSTNPTNFGNRRMVNGPFPEKDLFSVGQPFGGADQAAIGYIYTDLDAWPGWHNGWSPGNPNFHTDKYIASVFAGAAMSDHPHAAEWIEFGKRNYLADLKRVMLAPDGVGYECPGYSGFSVSLQIEFAKAFVNSGMGNPVVEYPLFKKTAIWHRKLITPRDFRIGLRHEAPHGDTHRWTSGMGEGFAKLAKFYKKSDPEFASELMGTYQLLKDSGVKFKGGDGLMSQIVDVDSSIPATDPAKLDWSSQHFYGFGPIMRSGFGTPTESFVSMKAGPTGGHYHNDNFAYHYYGDGTPISLDYNCSYHPRADHAALHNGATFGKEGQIKVNKTGKMARAWEQPFGTAYTGAFVGSPAMDVAVAERVTSGLTMSPLDPHDAEFQRRYPSRKTEKLVHRRFVALVKHPEASKQTDYLVVRDEFDAKEPTQVNVHVLAREAEVQDNLISMWGQYDKDIKLFVAESTDLKVEQDSYYYYDEWMMFPDDSPYPYKEGETQKEWAARMEVLKKEKGWDQIPGPDWKPIWGNGKSSDPEDPKSTIRWRNHVHKTHGKAMMPPPGWQGSWMYGENQMWLRLNVKPGTPVFWVLYPYPRGEEAPTFEAFGDGAGVKVTRGGETDVITMSTEGGVTIQMGGKETVLLKPGELPELGKIKRGLPTIDKRIP